MSAISFDTPKAAPAGFETATTVVGGRPRLTIDNPDFKADTVLVIDFNDSLEEHAAGMKGDSAQLADAVIKTDDDGIDVYTPGYTSQEPANPENGRPAGGFLGVRNPEFVYNLFGKVPYSGEEKVVEVLRQILFGFIAHFEAAGDKDAISALNAIVWTDGTFNLDELEALFVETANKLKQVGAPADKLGVQLLQVGPNKAIRTVFKGFDKGLKAKHGLDRDIVDAHKYNAGELNQGNITSIVTGALDKSQDDANDSDDE